MKIEIELDQLLQLTGQKQETCNTLTAFWQVGRKYFIRTVTHHHTGELVAITDQEIVLKHAAWIADDGRLTEALATGDFNEVEMFPSGNVLIGRGSLIDAVELSTIPRSQK